MKWLHHRQAWLLLAWFLLGLALRLTGLTSKPLWTDEFATIVFSLGNSFRTIPLDQTLTLAELLQPLQSRADATLTDVVQHLQGESNHPPLYFLLTHLWLKLFPASNGYVSVWGVRSLSAILGAFSIPATFGLSWLAFRSLSIAQTAAAFTALSPFGIYLAQEARHYTLPILWIIASLACLVLAIGRLPSSQPTLSSRSTPIPLWLCLVWIAVNALGIATHYFFLLTLGAEAFVLAGFVILRATSRQQSADGKRVADDRAERFSNLTHSDSLENSQRITLPFHLTRLALVALGTLTSILVWLPWMTQRQDSELTRWIYRGDRSGFEWLTPLGQLLGGWITMLYMLPIQAKVRGVAIASIVALLLLTAWTIPQIWRGLRLQLAQPDKKLAVQVLGGFVLGAIAIFLGITYLLGIDLTVAFRYNFVYFPAMMVLLAAALAGTYLDPKAPPHSFTRLSLMGCLSFLGALIVLTNLGYQKTHRPDLVVQAMQQNQTPALVAIAHRTHGQTGRLMGIAWEWQRTITNKALPEPQFLLAHQDQDANTAVTTLAGAIAALPRPLDLWLVNFRDVTPERLQATLEQARCKMALGKTNVDGYRYEQYHCTEM